MTTRALSLVAMMLVAACSPTPRRPLEAGRDAVARRRGHAGGYQAAVIRRVRRPGAWHEGRSAERRLHRRSVQGSGRRARQPGRHVDTEGSARRHHAVQDLPAHGVAWRTDAVLSAARTGRRVQPARDRRGEPREVRDGLRRLRRAGPRVPVGRFQGARRQGQDLDCARERSADPARPGEAGRR